MFIYRENIHGVKLHSELIKYLDLLESNIRRRGEVGGSAKKIGKRIKELERLYEIEHGGSRRNNCVLKTQEQLAKEMDMDVRTLQNYKMLADMIPELEYLIYTGIVTKNTAPAMMKIQNFVL